MGDTVVLTVSLFSISNTRYFYKLCVDDKLAYVHRLKAVAGEFFKQGNFAKSAKVYQKINGWYNFGDAANNYLKEEDDNFDTKNTQLMSIKQVCFTNLTVCKFKLQEWQSVVAITDQILEMDPASVKAFWFRGKAFAMLKEWDNAIEALK